MRKKILLFSILFSFATFFASAQVIFDPATVDSTKLSEGFDIVDIGGTKYLRVVLNGWNSWTFIPTIKIENDVTFSFQSKYAVGTSGFTVDQVNTFFKISDISWAELTANGAGSTTDFSAHSQSVATSGTAAILQVAGQETSGWTAVSGDTVYIGVVTATAGTVSDADTSLLDGSSMENGFLWSTGDYPHSAPVTATPVYTFNYNGDTLAYGTGGCLRIQAKNPGDGDVNSFMYKPVKVKGGETYKIIAAFRGYYRRFGF